MAYERKRLPLYTPVQSRDLAVFSGTPQRDQKLVNAMIEKIGEEIWIVKRPGMLAKGTIGPNPLIDLEVLESPVTSTFVGFTQTFTTGSGTVTVPAGARFVRVRVWGGGGGGSGYASSFQTGPSGGGGGGSAKSIALDPTDVGVALTYSIGTGGLGAIIGSPSPQSGTASTSTASALVAGPYSMSGGGGGAPNPTVGSGGPGGTSSGGDVNNSGARGGDFVNAGTHVAGGASATLDGISGGDTAAPGGGGYGGSSSAFGNGAAGRVDFVWSGADSSAIVQKRYSLTGDMTANKLWNIDTLTQIGGTLTGNQYKMTPSTGNTLLFIQGATKSYTMSPAEVITQVTSPGYPSEVLVPGVVAFDNYIFVMGVSGAIYNSDVNAPTAWTSTNKIIPQMEPDSGVTVAGHLNFIVAFKEFSTEFYYDAANPLGSPLARYENAKLDVGCAAAYSVAQTEGNLFWVSRTRAGGRSVYMLAAGQIGAQRISNDRIDNMIASFASSTQVASSMKAFCLKLRGHVMYVLTDTSQNVTLVYDANVQEWYYWSSFVNGVEQHLRVFCTVPSTGLTTPDSFPVTMDESTGVVYWINTPYTADTDLTPTNNTINVFAQTQNHDLQTRSRKFFAALEVIGDQAPTTVNISWTNDDFQTYATARSIDMSLSRNRIRNLGSANRRAFTLQHTDTTAGFRAHALDVDVEVGGI